MTPFELTLALFLFVAGACIGSFLNVVIWRLPQRGKEVSFKGVSGKLTLNWPPSHCPRCNAAIRWYQNVPVLAWIFLKGRCANCKAPYSIRYPLVELGTGLLWVGLYLAYFVFNWRSDFPNSLPPLPGADPRFNAAAFALHLLLVTALLVASAIDADWFIIPLEIPYGVAAIALLCGPVIDHPAIPRINLTDHPDHGRAVVAAAVGLLVSNLLVYLKVLPRSFSEAMEPEKDVALSPSPTTPTHKSGRVRTAILAVLALLILVGLTFTTFGPKPGAMAAVIAGIAVFLLGVLPKEQGQEDVADEVWQAAIAPGMRKEVLKEVAFLAIPLALAFAVYKLSLFTLPATPWVERLLGILGGFLIGGFVVWFVRILGTLAFNKEAMGLGDVPLMAAVGAVAGAPAAVLAFFLAPFCGIVWAVAVKVAKKQSNIPYGPWLSVASIIALVAGESIIQTYLAVMFPQ